MNLVYPKYINRTFDEVIDIELSSVILFLNKYIMKHVQLSV